MAKGKLNQYKPGRRGLRERLEPSWYISSQLRFAQRIARIED